MINFFFLSKQKHFVIIYTLTENTMSKDAYEKFIYFFKKHGLYDYKI